MRNIREQLAERLGLTEDEVKRLDGRDLSFYFLDGEIRNRFSRNSPGEAARQPLADGRSLIEVLLEDGPDAARSAFLYYDEARGGPFEAFSSSGSVDARRLSAECDIPMTVLAKAFGTTPEFLKEKPDAQEIQLDATMLLGSMNMLAQCLSKRKYARWWLRTPQRELGGLKPLDYLASGHLDLFVSQVYALVMMIPD